MWGKWGAPVVCRPRMCVSRGCGRAGEAISGIQRPFSVQGRMKDELQGVMPVSRGSGADRMLEN